MSADGARHCVITGATSGIGAATARLAVARGWRVTGIGRRRERLAALEDELGPDFQGQVGDVTEGASLAAAVAAGVAAHGPIDLLVANAGKTCDGELLELSPEHLAEVFDVNLLGVHRSVLASRPHWSAGARVVIVASVLSFLSVPRLGAYCASKHAVVAYAKALRMELAAEGVHVASLHPGTVATEFFDSPGPGRVWSWRPGPALPSQAVARATLALGRGRRRRQRSLPWTSPLVVALSRVLAGPVEALLRRRLARMRTDESEES